MTEMLELKAADNDTVITSAITGKNDEVHKLLRSLSEDERERLRILQWLLATAERPNYGKRQQAAAERLGITVRSVRRLVRQLREEGVVSVMRRSRSDRGEARISED